MVKCNEPGLDRTFAALADPTRRALLAQLGEQQSLSVSALARSFPVSLPAIMKHLDVLSDAGLITRTKTGRTVACRLTAAPTEQPLTSLNRYPRFSPDALDRRTRGASDELAEPVPALLVRRARSPCRLRGGGFMSTKPSLTIRRRLNAP